ncbi:hypothetical protein KW805_01760 [Candidatus Pacearchaeota archaeon]|nr:hypothetical protein [Candidatus Pacearchaeota archaeon]
MGWKNKPTWLKGGIIAATIFILSLFIIYVLSLINDQLDDLFLIPAIPIAIVEGILMPGCGFGGSILSGSPYYCIESQSYFIQVMAGLIVYFILGALIGWIYGKIKNK